MKTAITTHYTLVTPALEPYFNLPYFSILEAF
jgi:hypothetical protein